MTGHRIDVLGQRFYAHHGCMEEEAIIGQEYLVDVRIWVDLTPSAESDDLAQTVDYVDVHRICAREMATRSKLVEQSPARRAPPHRSHRPHRGGNHQIRAAHRRGLRPHHGHPSRVSTRHL